MFERYTERARRVIFFARYEASRYGDDHIEPHHLLLALLREDPPLMLRCLSSPEAMDGVRLHLEARFRKGRATSTSVDMPFSLAGKRALAAAAEEAFGSQSIETYHLLLGLLRVADSPAAEILRERGVTPERVRQAPQAAPPTPSPRDHLHVLLDRLPEDLLAKAERLLQALHRGAAGESQLAPSARHALFFARYEAAQFASPAIEPHHLLLGLLREDKGLGIRFLGSLSAMEELRREIASEAPPTDENTAPLDLTLSAGAQRALSLAQREAAGPPGCADLLIALLRVEGTLAFNLLTARGLTAEKVRAELGR